MREKLASVGQGLAFAVGIHGVLGFFVAEYARAVAAPFGEAEPSSVANILPHVALLLVPAAVVVIGLERARRRTGAPKPKRFTPVNVALALAGVAVGLFVSHLLWGVTGRAALGREIAALEKEGLAPPVPASAKPADDANAAIVLERAKGVLKKTLGPDFQGSEASKALHAAIDGFAKDGTTGADYEKARPLLESCREAMEIAAAAADLPDAFWDVGRGRVIDTPIPDFLPYQTLAKLFSLQAIKRANAGDIPGAAASIRVGLAMGDAIARGPGLFSRMVHGGMKATMLGTARRIFDTPEELAAAEAAWARHLDARAAVEDAKTAFRLELVAVPREMVAQGEPARSLGMQATPAAAVFGSAFYLAMRDILRGQRPILESVAKAGDAIPEGAPSFLVRAGRNAAHLAVARAAIEHAKGAPLGLDPFTGTPLKVVPSGEGALVYSVGPDRKDDGGAPFDTEKDRGDIAWFVARAP